MKKLVHLLEYLLRRQFFWVLGYWILVAAQFGQFDRPLFSNLILVGVIVSAFVLVLRIHDHLEGSVLIGRPIAKGDLHRAELIFLFGVLILPLVLGMLFVLTSHKSTGASYLASFLFFTFLTSQLVLWYVAGKLAKSSFDVFLLVFLCYFPVFLLWGVVGHLSRHGSVEPTVYLVLGVVGFLSLLLVVFSLRPPTRNLLFTGSAGALLLAFAGVRWDYREKATSGPESKVRGNPDPGTASVNEIISVKLAPTSPPDGDPMKDSHWDIFQITSSQKNEIVVPTGILDHPFSWRGSHFSMKWNQAAQVMKEDLILRSFPAGADLHGTAPTLRFQMEQIFFEEGRKMLIGQDGEATFIGNQLTLLEGGSVSLREGEKSSVGGYRTMIQSVRFLPTRLSVEARVSWVTDSFLEPPRERVRTAWVLYSPLAGRGILVHGLEIDSRRRLLPDLVKRHGEFLDFPLPETFTDFDDVELRVYFLIEGKSLKFRVPLPKGEYLVR